MRRRRIKYRYKLVRIKLDLYRKLFLINIAGVLVRIAYTISPQLEKSTREIFGADAVRRYVRDNY